MSADKATAIENLKKGFGFKVGRPKGVVNKETLLKQKAQKEMNIRIAKMAGKLLNAQAIVATGTHKVVTFETDEKTGEKKFTVVRDEKEIEDLLTNGKYGEDYLVLEASPADWKAANALLDRVFGKAKESIDISGEVKFTLRGLAERRKVIDVPVINLIEGETTE